jgi:hypothetical protein
MSDPACRNYRELLGVYVVGAIEPSERSLLDNHLTQCYDCREELAGLAVLPALLHRISPDEAERLAQPGQDGLDPDDPAPQVLSGLLGDVRAQRRSMRLRGVLAAAAAVVIAAGGSVAISGALGQASRTVASAKLEQTVGRAGPVVGTVRYGPSHWGGTEIWTRVSGLPEWTRCKFWVNMRGGGSVLVAGWLTGPGADTLWYPSQTDIPATSIRSFTLTAAGKVLVTIPSDHPGQ